MIKHHAENIHNQIQDEAAIVLSIKDAFERIRPLEARQEIELSVWESDIQPRMFKKFGGEGGVVAQGGTPLLDVATAVMVTPGLLAGLHEQVVYSRQPRFHEALQALTMVIVQHRVL